MKAATIHLDDDNVVWLNSLKVSGYFKNRHEPVNMCLRYCRDAGVMDERIADQQIQESRGA